MAMSWQDGFEGAEDLLANYDGPTLGTAISVGTGRNGGNTLSGSLRRVTGLLGDHDPVTVGIANNGQDGGGIVFSFEDALGPLAQVSLGNLGRVEVFLSSLSVPVRLITPGGNPRVGSLWRYLEVTFSADPLAGVVDVAIDGDTVLTFTGKTVPASPTLRPDYCRIGPNGLLDDFYINLGTGVLGDYRITGTAPAAGGAVPALGMVKVDQQFINYAEVAPKSNATVDQQYIIVVIKNKGPAKVRPQVFGVGRT